MPLINIADMVPYSKIHSKVSLLQGVPSGWDVYSIPGSRALYGNTKAAETLIQYYTSAEFSLYFARMQAKARENLMLVREQPAYFLIVQLENTLTFSLPCMAQRERLLEWSFNIFYAPVFELEIELRKNAMFETFFLIVPEAFMFYLAKHYHFLDPFLKKARDKVPQTLLPYPKICPLNIIQKINCIGQRMDDANLPFAEDLLSLALESANSVPYRKMTYADEVIERLYALKAFLQNHLESNFTRTELMKRFHLNEQQFSKGFAAIYNVTPFSLIKMLKQQAE